MACLLSAPRAVAIAAYALQPLFVAAASPLLLPWMRNGEYCRAERVVALVLFALCASSAVALDRIGSFERGGRTVVDLAPVVLLARRPAAPPRPAASIDALCALLASATNALRVVVEERVTKVHGVSTLRITTVRAPALALLALVVVATASNERGGGGIEVRALRHARRCRA